MGEEGNCQFPARVGHFYVAHGVFCFFFFKLSVFHLLSGEDCICHRLISECGRTSKLMSAKESRDREKKIRHEAGKRQL